MLHAIYWSGGSRFPRQDADFNFGPASETAGEQFGNLSMTLNRLGKLAEGDYVVFRREVLWLDVEDFDTRFRISDHVLVAFDYLPLVFFKTYQTEFGEEAKQFVVLLLLFSILADADNPVDEPTQSHLLGPFIGVILRAAS